MSVAPAAPKSKRASKAQAITQADASPLFNYVVSLADDALVLGHRLSEWSGRGPSLEEDIALSNLALDLMGRNTGAFEPVFDNNLANLKYPAITQYDAIFLNSTTGDVFTDPEVLSGLTRFILEGGGLAGIHGASYTSMILPAFSR